MARRDETLTLSISIRLKPEFIERLDDLCKHGVRAVQSGLLTEEEAESTIAAWLRDEELCRIIELSPRS